jgi:hypothetical protein
VLRAPEASLASVRLGPDNDVDEIEAEVATADEDEFDAAPVNERPDKAAVDDVECCARHPGAVECREFLAAHFAGRHGEFSVMRLRGHVANVGHVIGLVSQHEARLFARQHQAFVARRVPRVGLQKAVATQDPDVARPRDGPPCRNESRIGFPNAVVRLVIQQQEIDLRRLEPGDHDVLAQIDQLGEFDPQRLFVPLSRLAEAVERD